MQLNSYRKSLNINIAEANKNQIKTESTINDLATGKINNLQEAVLQIDQAEIELKFAMEVRNKLIGAYKEILRTQV